MKIKCSNILPVIIGLTLIYFTTAYAQVEPKNSVEENPSWRQYNELGVQSYKLKKYEEAIDYYEQALKLTPDNTRVLNNYALVLYQLARFSDVIAVSNQAVEHTDNVKAQANAYFNKGRALERLERNKDALSAYEQAQGLAATNARKEAVERLRVLLAANAGSSERRNNFVRQENSSDKSAASGDYRLKITKGSNYALCRDIKGYFEKHKGEVCDIKSDPEFPLLRGAGYRAIDINDYAEAYMESILYGKPKKYISESKKRMQGYMQAGKINAWYVRADGDYDGVKEELITITRSHCPVEGSRTFVIKSGEFSAKYRGGLGGELFFYDGKPFYIKTSGKSLYVVEVTADVSQYPGGGIQNGEVWIWDVCHIKIEGQ